MRFINIDKPITTKHAELGDLKIDNAEVPQCDNLDECVTFAGGQDELVAFFNSQVETNAKNGGRAALRNAPKDANIDQLYEKVRGIVKDYSPRTGEAAPGKAKKAAAFDDIKSLVESGKEFTRAQLLELLAKAK